MECDDCNAQLNISPREFIEQQELLGAVLCYHCINGTGRSETQVMEAE